MYVCVYVCMYVCMFVQYILEIRVSQNLAQLGGRGT